MAACARRLRVGVAVAAVAVAVCGVAEAAAEAGPVESDGRSPENVATADDLAAATGEAAFAEVERYREPWDRLSVHGSVLSAIMWGSMDQLRKAVDTAKEAGLDFNDAADWGGRLLPLHFAAREGHKGAVKLFVEHAGAEVSARDGVGHPAVIAALVGEPTKRSQFQDQILEYFLRNGGDAEATTPEGNPAVHLAAFWGRLEALKALFSHGASAAQKDGRGCGVLHEFARSRYLNNMSGGEARHAELQAMLDLLLESGAELDQTCVVKGSDGPVSAADYAAARERLPVAKALYDRGAALNPDLPATKRFMTALVDAVGRGEEPEL